MESIKTAVLSACAISLIIGMVQMLLPAQKYDRQIRLFTACLMLIGILAPLVKSVQELDLTVASCSDGEDYAETLETQAQQEMLTEAETEVADVLQQALAAQAIPCSQMTVTMHMEEDGSISITNVTVISTVPEKAEEAIAAYVGKDVEIHAADHT